MPEGKSRLCVEEYLNNIFKYNILNILINIFEAAGRNENEAGGDSAK